MAPLGLHDRLCTISGCFEGDAGLAGGDVPQLDGEVARGGGEDALGGGVEEDMADLSAAW